MRKMKEKIKLAIGKSIFFALYSIFLFFISVGNFFFPMKKSRY